jgi:beta-glucosidase/6-phospho-beta-glucosidase/beta-galactosidase
MTKADFGPSFIWGTAASAYQTEGAYLDDGKGCPYGMCLLQRPVKFIKTSMAR